MAEEYSITGMSCAACSSAVEKAVKKVEGVTSCSVSLLTNSMVVEGSASEGDVIKAVEGAGYGASVKGEEKASSSSARVSSSLDSLRDTESPKLKKRLISSIVFLLVLMYFSMGHMIGLPLPDAIGGNSAALGLVELLLSAIVLVINQKFFINGFKGLLHKSPNMDTLVALGSGASFIYSVALLFGVVLGYLGSAHYYFESAAMILTLITVGKMLEAISKGKTTDALKDLLKMAPMEATVERSGVEVKIAADDLVPGDVMVVRDGENIAADGVVLEGSSSVDESMLTGESIPVDKEEGSVVHAATIMVSGFMKVRVTRTGSDTTFSKIVKMVEDASSSKAPIAKVADKVSGIFVPSVITIALVTLVVWMLVGKEFSFSLSRAISVLVISCPCALGLATPVAIMVGSGKGAKNGILFKNAEALEETGRVSQVALDKTGTITKGKPEVTDIFSYMDGDESLLSIAYSLEAKSGHPLARAIIKKGGEEGVPQLETSDYETLPGNGIKGTIDGKEIFGGSYSFISKITDVDGNAKAEVDRLSGEGKTPVLFSTKDKLLGIIALADTLKDDSIQAVRELKDMGIKVVMLTGDNQRTADAIGRKVGVSEVVASVLPDGKEKVVSDLLKHGKTAMVGDGINDAPALSRASVGIAIGNGTDVAISSSSVVLMRSSLLDVPAAIRLSRRVLRNIHQNLFWAFIYNAIGIPLAAGLYYPLFGWTLSPMFGALAMSLSSFSVVSNALRLNFVDVHSTKYDIKTKKVKEKKKMEKTLVIEGMMCGHCEARVKKALEAVDGVESAIASHEKGNAIVTLSKNVSDEVLKKAVEDQDYKVTSIN